MMLVKHDTGAPRFGIVILGVAVILVTVVGVKYLYIFDTAALGEQVDMAIPGITALPRAGISRFTDPEIVTPLDDLVDPAADLTCCHVVKALFVEHDHVVDVHLFPVQLVRPQQFHEQPIRGSPDNFVHAMKLNNLEDNNIMPKLYEYLGIIIRFYSDEHEPIHVHALYAGCELKISFMVKDGMVKRITYTAIIGKFPRSKLDALKQFISLKKRDIVQAWCDYFVYHREISCVKITEKRSKIAEKRSKS